MSFDISKSFFFFIQTFFNVSILIVLAFLFINLFHWITARVRKSPFQIRYFNGPVLMYIICFAFLGFTLGLMIGLSQSPVIEVAIPAMLSFYGGFVTYLFTKKEPYENDLAKYAMAFSIMAVSVFLVYGIEIGSAEKNKALEIKRKFDLYYFEKEEMIKKKYK